MLAVGRAQAAPLGSSHELKELLAIHATAPAKPSSGTSCVSCSRLMGAQSTNTEPRSLLTLLKIRGWGGERQDKVI